VKRLQIYIQEEMDEALAVEAARSGTSKAALIRAAVAEKYASAEDRRDPIDDIVGMIDIPVQPGDIDDVVYGR
jgi:hypothetical protein